MKQKRKGLRIIACNHAWHALITPLSNVRKIEQPLQLFSVIGNDDSHRGLAPIWMAIDAGKTTRWCIAIMRHGDKAWCARFIVIKWRLIDANVGNIYQRGEARGKKEGKRRVEMSERGFRGRERGEREREGRMRGEERDRVSIENPGQMTVGSSTNRSTRRYDVMISMRR